MNEEDLGVKQLRTDESPSVRPRNDPFAAIVCAQFVQRPSECLLI